MKVLIIANQTTKYQSLIQTLTDDSTEVSICSYRDLAFSLDGDRSTITCFNTGNDLRGFDKILILATSPGHLQNYIFSALACYCRKYDIEMLDNSFSNTDGKLYALWRFWEQDIPVAKTLFGPNEYLLQQFIKLSYPCILKSVQGTKGKDSHLVHSADELRQILEDNLDTRYILQDFIPNDGDWRIILTNFTPKLAIYRSSHGKDFRNNTSVGGEAKLVPLEKVDSTVLDLSIAAAKALDIKIAGADILPDSQTGTYTVLEVNRTPQLATGAFIDAKAAAIRDLIHS